MNVQVLVYIRNTLGNLWPLFELFKDKNEQYTKTIRGWADPLVVLVVQIQQEMKEKGQTANPGDCTFLEYLATTTQGISHLSRVDEDNRWYLY